MSGIQYNMKSWVAFVLAVLVCLLVYPTAAEDGVDVKELFTRINTTTDSVIRHDSFLRLREVFEASDRTEQSRIRQAYLAAWSDAPLPTADEEDLTSASNIELRYSAYASNLGPYVNDEAELLSLFQARFVDNGLYRGRRLFLDALTRVRFPLGELSAAKAESLYNQLRSGNMEGFERSDQAYLEADIHLFFARCGNPGLAAILRLGTDREALGLDAIGRMKTEESDAFLWEVYDQLPLSAPKTRVTVLRGLLRYNAEDVDMKTRRTRIRQEISSLLAIPSGEYILRAMEKLLSLVAQTNDPFYLPRVVALEGWLAESPPELNTDYHASMEQEAMARGRLDDVLEECLTRLKNAKPIE